MGYIPNIDTPKSFNEKLIHRKFHENLDYIVPLADKYLVREFIEKRLGEKYLPKLLFVGNDFDQIDWDALPKEFVIKTNHGGGGEGIYLIKNKDSADREEIKTGIEKALVGRFGYYTNEDWYLKIKPQILIEEFMTDENNAQPSDYKFFCFHGKCHYIQVNSGRETEHKLSFYDKNWELQAFSLKTYKIAEVEKPNHLKEMIEVAEKLSSGFDFVRVDLYSLPDGVRFGEMTFCPNGGFEAISPRHYDYEMGKLWK